MILGFDASQFQGTNIDFTQVKAAGYLIGFTRMTYAYPDQPITIDPTANHNYYGMVSAGILPGGYHKVGWTDPIAEADAYVNAMSPLSANDGLMYDIEPASDVAIPANWSEWEQQYVQRIFDRTHTYPFRYLDISMTNSMPKQGVVVNCPSWVAAPSFGWNATLPVNVPVVVQQGPAVHIPGITANVCDTDGFFFNSINDYLKCTYQPIVAVSEPTPVVSTPPVVQTTTSTSEPVKTPSTQATTPVAPISTVPEPVATKTNTSQQNQINTLKQNPLSTGSASTSQKYINVNLKKSSLKTTTGFWSMLWNWFLRLVGIK